MCSIALAGCLRSSARERSPPCGSCWQSCAGTIEAVFAQLQFGQGREACSPPSRQRALHTSISRLLGLQSSRRAAMRPGTVSRFKERFMDTSPAEKSGSCTQLDARLPVWSIEVSKLEPPTQGHWARQLRFITSQLLGSEVYGAELGAARCRGPFAAHAMPSAWIGGVIQPACACNQVAACRRAPATSPG